MKKVLVLLMVTVLLVMSFTGCEYTDTTGAQKDTQNTIEIANKLQTNQPTPDDIDYSLERYNLIRRTYWVN